MVARLWSKVEELGEACRKRLFYWDDEKEKLMLSGAAPAWLTSSGDKLHEVSHDAGAKYQYSPQAPFGPAPSLEFCYNLFNVPSVVTITKDKGAGSQGARVPQKGIMDELSLASHIRLPDKNATCTSRVELERGV